MNGSLRTDALLGSVPTIEGFKVLEPCVLYDRVGQGGMGVVYRARYLQLDIDVAVKCLKGQGFTDEINERFQREAVTKLAASDERIEPLWETVAENAANVAAVSRLESEIVAKE